MEASELIARLLGPVIAVISVPMLVRPQSIQALASGFLKDRPLIFVTGVGVMVGGLAIVNSHNFWVADWPVVITVFGWAMVIGGAVRVAAPSVVETVGGAMMERPAMTRAAGGVWLVIGAVLIWQGCF